MVEKHAKLSSKSSSPLPLHSRLADLSTIGEIKDIPNQIG